MRSALLIVACAVTVVAQNPASEQADRIGALHREAEALARQERTLLNELRQLEVARKLRTEQLRRTSDELADVTRQREDAALRLSALERQVSADRPALAVRLAQLYKLGAPGYARLLLDVDGVRAAGRAYRTVSALAASDRRRARQFRDDLDNLRATERALADRTARAAALHLQAQAAKAAADQAVAAHTRLIARIDARRDLNARLAGELLAAQQKLSALTPVPPSAAPTTATGLSLVSLRGALDWPAPGPVTTRFGAQRDPVSGVLTMRPGVEIGAAAGVAAQAVEEGVVTHAEPFVGFGNLVVVEHGQQAHSLYGYLDEITVRRGTRVARGQTLGTVGQNATGKPGLYFELRIDGKPVDPVQWLKKR